MSATRLAARYAKAILDLAIETRVLDSVQGDMSLLQHTLVQNRDFELMLKSPIINTDKKRHILKRIFAGSFHNMTNKFLDIILRKRRETYLPDIVTAFIEQYQAKKGIVIGSLVTAAPVSDDLIDDMQRLVLQQTGKLRVELDVSIDESLIGGFILRFEDKLYDTSVAHKLNLLGKRFEENKYVRKI